MNTEYSPLKIILSVWEIKVLLASRLQSAAAETRHALLLDTRYTFRKTTTAANKQTNTALKLYKILIL